MHDVTVILTCWYTEFEPLTKYKDEWKKRRPMRKCQNPAVYVQPAGTPRNGCRLKMTGCQCREALKFIPLQFGQRERALATPMGAVSITPPTFVYSQ